MSSCPDAIELPAKTSTRPWLRRILIIDDSRTLRKLIGIELQPLGAEIREARNGEEGLEIARSWLPDLITLDIEMPGMQGYEVCEHLKEDERTMGIPVIMISTLPSDTERLQALTTGAMEYYVKPFPRGALCTFVRGLGEERRAHRDHTIFVLEGSRSLRAKLERSLSEDGYRCRAFEEPGAMMAALRSENCDLIILDVSLDNHAGFRALLELRSQPNFERLPVIALTNSSARDHAVVVFRAGAHDLIRTPFFPEDLRARVDNQLRVLRLERRLRADASIDPLTGLYNRREMERLLKVEVERARRDRRPLGLVLVDVDHFKQVNDTRGHVCGDRVLQGIAAELFNRVRATDIVARYGGEEFAILLPNAGEKVIGYVAERIRLNLETLVFDSDEGESFQCTVSMGGVSYDSEQLSESTVDLFKPADRALYRSKDQGRNRVSIEILPERLNVVSG